MPIQVTCPTCNGMFNAPDSAAGKEAKCPKCGGVMRIPASSGEEVFDAEPDTADQFADGDVSEPTASLPDAGDRKACPMCGEMIQKEALKCRFCGQVFDATLVKMERKRGPGPVHGESVEEAAKRLIAEKQEKSNAIVIFVTSLLGCFSPIVAIYGIVFLLRRPYSFPYKGLAIASTIIHCLWTLLLIVGIVLGQFQG